MKKRNRELERKRKETRDTEAQNKRAREATPYSPPPFLQSLCNHTLGEGEQEVIHSLKVIPRNGLIHLLLQVRWCSEADGDVAGVDHEVLLGVLDVDLVHLCQGQLVSHHVQAQTGGRGLAFILLTEGNRLGSRVNG